MPIEIIKDDHTAWDAWKKELDLMEKKVVKVGVLEGSDDHKSEDGRPPVKMVVIAATHEFGADITVTDKMRWYLHNIGIHLRSDTTKIHIPERSFLRTWVEENKSKIEEAIGEMFDQVNTGKLTAKKALNKLGAFAESGIKEKFKNNDWEPLKFRSGSPLIDKGQLRASIHHKVADVGEPE